MVGLYFYTLFSFSIYHRLLALTRKQMASFCIGLFCLSCLVFYLFANHQIVENLPIFLKNFPHITIQKGILVYPDIATSATLPNTPFKIQFDLNKSVPPSNEEMIKNQLIMFVNRNNIYSPGPKQLQVKPIPAELSIDTTQEFLQDNKKSFSTTLQIIVLLFSFVAIPLVLISDAALAFTVLFAFMMLTRKFVPFKTLIYWAIALLGPLTMLWYIHLFISIPLFLLAKLILCIIYSQQIFNLQEVK